MKDKLVKSLKRQLQYHHEMSEDELDEKMGIPIFIKPSEIEFILNKLSHPSDNAELIKAAKYLLSLHACEQEGIASGQPTQLQWLLAVNKLEQALRDLEKKL